MYYRSEQHTYTSSEQFHLEKGETMLAQGNKNFRAPGEHGFSFVQVKTFTGSVSVLLTSTSLKIRKLKLAEATRENEHRSAMHFGHLVF